MLLVKAQSKTHLGTLKASLMLSQGPKIMALVQLRSCSLARSYRLTRIYHIFRWGDWKRAFNKDVWEKTSGNEMLVHTSDPGVFVGLVFCITYSWSTRFRCFRVSQLCFRAAFRVFSLPLSKAEKLKDPNVLAVMI